MCNTTFKFPLSYVLVPFFTDLVLLYYKSKWIKKMKNDTSRARSFANVFNTTLTNGEIEFSLKRSILLNFKKEYVSINEESSLDLLIEL